MGYGMGFGVDLGGPRFKGMWIFPANTVGSGATNEHMNI